MPERLCTDCGGVLYKHEGSVCFPCWYYEIQRFDDLVVLGSIGQRLAWTGRH